MNNQFADPEAIPLHDIYLPETVSWWPLAPGWWFIGILFVLIVAGTVLLYQYRKRRDRSLYRQALLELERLRNTYSDRDDAPRLLHDLSALLRRVAISLYGRERIASLSGKAWLALLDRGMPEGRSFSDGVGRVLLSGPYQRVSQFDSDALFDLAEAWIRHGCRRKIVGGGQAGAKHAAI